MKRVLLVGNGARENAIADALIRSKKHEVELTIIGSALNPGLEKLAKHYLINPLNDLEGIVNLAKKEFYDFAIIGPENPIEMGLTDALREVGIKTVAPLKEAAKIESSKSFTRDLLAEFNIEGNPKFKVFSNLEGAEDFFEELEGEFVVKADGLEGGKGVKLSGEHLRNYDEALAFMTQCIEKTGTVVVEEKFIGQEFSLHFFCDGETLVPMPICQDHKRAYDGDKGPNTGGMGSYSNKNHLLPFLEEDDKMKGLEISKKVVKAIFEKTGVKFKGFLYGGFMATKNGVKLVEYNCRFGDPETENMLSILESDLVDICEAILEENLLNCEIKFLKKATVCKYIVPEGYPLNSVKNEEVEIGVLEFNSSDNLKVYFAAIDKRNEKFVMTGSRAIAVVGIADSIVEAEKIASNACKLVKGKVFYRNDIGTEKVLEKKIQFMKELRS